MNYVVLFKKHCGTDCFLRIEELPFVSVRQMLIRFKNGGSAQIDDVLYDVKSGRFECITPDAQLGSRATLKELGWTLI